MRGGLTYYECGEAYDEGNCCGCGQPLAQCASQLKSEDELCHLEFQDYNGSVIYRISARMNFEKAGEMVDIFTFPFSTGVYAVRIQQGRRVVLHRRKGTGRAYRVTEPVAVAL